MHKAFTSFSRAAGLFGFAGIALVVVAASFLGLAGTHAQEGLSATLAGDPSSGQAPLTDVDMAATVSGGGGLPLTYRIDCTGDGSYEREFTTSSEQYKAIDLCNYSNPGNYTARLQVERNDGVTAQATTSVNSIGLTPTPPAGNQGTGGGGAGFQQQEADSFDLTMASRVSGQNSWNGTQNVRPGDLVQLLMRVENTGNGSGENVHLKVILPANFQYAGNIRLDGSPITGDPTSAMGVRVANIPNGEARELAYDVLVAPAGQWQVGTTTRIIAGLAYNGNKADSASTTLLVNRQAVAAAPVTPQQPAQGGQGFSPIFDTPEPASEREVLAQEPQPQVPQEDRGFLANLTAGNIFEDPIRSILIAALVVSVILIIGLGFVMRKSPTS